MCCKHLNIPFSHSPTRLSSGPVPSDEKTHYFLEKKGRNGSGGIYVNKFIPIRPVRINYLNEIISILFCFLSALGFAFLIWWIFA